MWGVAVGLLSALAAAPFRVELPAVSVPPPSWLVPRVHFVPPAHLSDVSGATYTSDPFNASNSGFHLFVLTNPSIGMYHFRTADLVRFETRGLYASGNPNVTTPLLDSGGVGRVGDKMVAVSMSGLKFYYSAAKGHSLDAWADQVEVFNSSLPGGRGGLPGDPLRLWQDDDGRWYTAVAKDACYKANETNPPSACPGGGLEELWSTASESPLSSDAEWERVGHLVETNRTAAGAFVPQRTEFVTPDFFGLGERSAGAPRVLLSTVYGPQHCCDAPAYWNYAEFIVGDQPAPGSPLLPDWERSYPVDWGAFKPKGSPGPTPFPDSDDTGLQVLTDGAYICCPKTAKIGEDGRRVMFANLGYTTPELVALALPRDVWLSADGRSLRQSFVSELGVLRDTHEGLGPKTLTPAPSRASAGVAHQINVAGPRLEILASFSNVFSAAGECGPAHEFGVLVFGSDDFTEHAAVGFDARAKHVFIDRTNVGKNATFHDVRAGPCLSDGGESMGLTMHVYVDHSIVTVIANNQTAITVYAPRGSKNSIRVAPYALGGCVDATLDVWKLDAVYSNISD